MVSTNTAATALEEGSGQSLTVTPSAAAPGDTVTISGRLECPASAPGGHVLGHVEYADDDLWVRTSWDGGGDTAASYPQLDADRRFSVDWTIPTTMHEYGPGGRSVPTPAGTFHIFVFCGEGTGPGTQEQTSFTVLAGEQPTTTEAPTTTQPATTTTEPAAGWTPPVQPPSIAEVFENRPIGEVPAGSTIQIDEDGFIPGEEVHVVLYSSPRVLASIIADATGAVRAAVTIPADTEPGEHVLVLYGSEMVRAMAFDVTAAPSDPQPGVPQPDGSVADRPDGPGGSADPARAATGAASMPRTGVDGTLVLALTGFALTAAGIAVLRFRSTLTGVRP